MLANVNIQIDEKYLPTIQDLVQNLNGIFTLVKNDEIKIPILDQAIKEYENGEVERAINFEEYKKAINADL